MEFFSLSQAFNSILAGFLLILSLRALVLFWFSPIQVHRKLQRGGFRGPSPRFPLGNIEEMTKKKEDVSNFDSINNTIISHDIHSTVFPYFARWQNSHGKHSHFSTVEKQTLICFNSIAFVTICLKIDIRVYVAGKVFIYWLGTEPFLYIADPEFLKKMSTGVLGKSWGKPNVFRHDRQPMFGNGLVMVEGDDWVRHRHVITPAFSPANLKVFLFFYNIYSLMVVFTVSTFLAGQKVLSACLGNYC